MIKTQPMPVQTAPTQARAEPAPHEAKPIRLLHVEDNRADALLTQEYIRAVLPTVEFDNAVRLSDVTPELVGAADCAILDLSLPDAEGLEALVALRAMSDALPIIVLTGFDNLELGLAAVRDGADDYLIKNHIDSYTLERAVQYSIERRSLMRELISSAAETTVAAAATIAADAALAAAAQLALVGFDQDWRTAAGAQNVAVGTHQVAVHIDDETGDYTLVCQTCDWESNDVSDDVHSWAARSLDVALLRHVTLGDKAEAGPALDADAASSPAAHSATEPVSRRAAFNPRGWLG